MNDLFYFAKHPPAPSGRWSLDHWVRRIDGALRGKIGQTAPARVTGLSSRPLYLMHYLTQNNDGSPALRRLRRLVLGGGFMLLMSAYCFAQDYYVAPNGSDGNPGTSAAPWATFGKAWGTLRPGDKLIAKDGTYAQSISPTISGAAGTPITIKAENDGGAVIDGGGVRSGISVNGKSHLVIEGFRIQNPGERPAVEVISPDGTAVASQANNITIRRVGARGGAMTSNNHVWTVARVRDSLFEDVWGWGNGRYVMNVYGATRVTVRRAVFRWDAWGIGADKPGDPKFDMGVYNTHDSLFENILLIDAANTALAGDKGGLYVPGNSNGPTAPYTDSDNNRFYGLLAMNNVGHGVAVEGGSGGPNNNNVFVDLVSWRNTGHGFTVPKNAIDTQFIHATFGANYRGGYSGGGGNNVSNLVLTNSVVTSNASYGLNGPVASAYNNIHGNGSNYGGGASAGAGTISQDPLMDYIPRQETDSPDKRSASDGGDRGGTVLNRYENGSLTAASLWPWPNETRIKADLCESATRGLCGASAPLTDYIWETLGNPTPPEFQPGGAPTAANLAVTTNEDAAAAVTLSGADPDGSAVTYAVVSSPSHGALTGAAPNLTYTPAANYHGADSFTYRVTDAVGDESPVATVALTVQPVNDAPGAVSPAIAALVEDSSAVVTLSAFDVDGDTLTFAAGAPAHGVLQGTGPSRVYVPAPNFTGPDSFTFEAVDPAGARSAITTVAFNVTPLNDAPAAASTSTAVVEDGSAVIRLSASDPDGDPLTYVLETPAHGTLSGAGPDVTYVPAADYNGADAFSFKVRDPSGAESAAAVASINISPIEDAPVAESAAVLTNEDISKAVVLSAVDPDGGALTYLIVRAPYYGRLTGTAPYVTYVPAANDNGPDSFTFRARDASGAYSAISTVTVTIYPVNDAPVSYSTSATTDENVPKAVTLRGYDVDADTLTYVVVRPPAQGGLSGAAPALTYVPQLGFSGSDSFTYRVRDNSGVESAVSTVTLTVRAVAVDPPPPPTAVSAPENALEHNLALGPLRLRAVTTGAVSAALLFTAPEADEQTIAMSPEGDRFAAEVPADQTAFRLGACSYRVRATDAWGRTAFSEQRTVTLVHSVESAPDANAQVHLPGLTPAEDAARVDLSSLSPAERPASIILRSLERDAVGPGPQQQKAVAAYQVQADNRVSSVFSKPVLLSLSYPDRDRDGIVDGAGVKASTLRIYHHDGQTWRLVGGRVHSDERMITAQVPHFSTFALFSQAAGAALARSGKPLFLTPLPLDGHNDTVSFPAGSKRVEVHDVNGRRVFAADGDGVSAVVWTGRDEFGRVLESGSYIARVVDAQDQSAYQLVILAK